MASRRRIRKAKARKQKPHSEQQTLRSDHGCLNGPVLSVEMGKALSYLLFPPIHLRLQNPENLYSDFFFFNYAIVCVVISPPWLFSAISDLRSWKSLGTHKGRRVSIWLSTISALELCSVQLETNSWTPLISCLLCYLIIQFCIIFRIHLPCFIHFISI